MSGLNEEEQNERLEVTNVVLRLLEQVVDLGIDLGVEVTPKYMSALTLMLQGRSYKTVGRDLDIDSRTAREYAMCAVKQLLDVREKIRSIKG